MQTNNPSTWRQKDLEFKAQDLSMHAHPHTHPHTHHYSSEDFTDTIFRDGEIIFGV